MPSSLPIGRLLAAVLFLWVGAATAQQPYGAATSPQANAGPAAAPNPAVRALRSALDTARLELDQQASALQRPTLSANDLQDLRARIDPISERLRDTVAEIVPQLEAAKGRLDQLGPKPKEGAPGEGPDIARDRAEREAAVAEFDDTQRLSRALLLQAEQLTGQISDRRRTAFATALLERSYGLVSPDLWVSLARSLPRDLRALGTVLQDAAGRIEGRASPTTLTLFGLAIGTAIAFHVTRRHLAPRMVRRARGAVEVNGRRKLLAALAVLLFEALPVVAGSFVIYQLLLAADLLPARLMPVLAALLSGLAFVAFVRAALDATVASDRPAWRLVSVSDPAAGSLTLFAVAFAAVVASGKVLDALNGVIAAGLPLAVASRAVVALLAALTLAELLRRLAAAEPDGDDCLGPAIPAQPEIGGPVRLLGWVVVAVIVAGVGAGYVALASFVVDQVAWIGSLALLLYFAISATDEFLGRTLTGQSLLSTSLQTNLGLRRRSLEQLGVLGAGLARVVLALAAAMLALAPWGVESGDIASNIRAAFFGFRVGDVTVSLSTTIGGFALFGLGIGATRIVQRWLSSTFLPTTELDAGLRNSLETAAGYLGFFAAAALALSYLGLGLEKIALVAGALSVGIGFGLQSIVNNFVSGLILLWERPIRVGDLVVIGDGEGYVRRISVRATEIETFDRSAVIIPNSSLISGVVKNRVRGDRTARIIVPVQVLRSQDPAKAAELLTGCAERHADVMAEPPPRVVFKKIGDTWLDFELVCYVDDVAKQQRVSSDLHFAVFDGLVREGILPPMGPGATTVLGLEQAQAALATIAEELAARGAGASREP